MNSFEEAVAATHELLRADEVGPAYFKLTGAVRHPLGAELAVEQWRQALEAYTQVFASKLPELSQAARTAAAQPDSPQANLDFGIAAQAADLPEVASSALARVNRLVPNEATLLNKLAFAYERQGLYGPATDALAASPTARTTDWFLQYRYAFNAFMAARSTEARQAVAAIGPPPPQEANADEVMANLSLFRQRMDRISSVSALGANDLRGWHYVTSGGVVTHVSEYGPEQMQGRYAVVQDSYSLVLEGIQRARIVLAQWGVDTSQIIISNDRASHVLGAAWQRVAGSNVVLFDPTMATTPGLFVAYDNFGADNDFVEAQRYRGSGQVLVNHALCWTESYPFSGDVVTFHYQTNREPWGAQIQVGGQGAPDQSPPDVLANQVASAEVSRENLGDLDALVALARSTGAPTEGYRDRFHQGSGVASARF